jgi:hypothetical protein
MRHDVLERRRGSHIPNDLLFPGEEGNRLIYSNALCLGDHEDLPGLAMKRRSEQRSLSTNADREGWWLARRCCPSHALCFLSSSLVQLSIMLIKVACISLIAEYQHSQPEA